ncbi:MAG: hypothetical protein ACD_32C00132G0001, partial [uncultured bacterium]
MRLIKSINWQKLTFKLIKHKYLLLFFSLLFWVYWTNTFHTNFSDEFDNIVGGWYITKGILPYRGFFSHHNPGAYFISSLIVLFTRQSFVHFRIVWAIALFTTSVMSYVYLTKIFSKDKLKFFLLYLLILGVSSTYYWGQMMLSETIVAYVLIPSYALVVLKAINGKAVNLRDVAFISVMSAIALYTSLTFIFAIILLWIFSLYLFVKNKKIFSRPALKALTIIVLPYVLLALYLISTGSLSEYIFQSIRYNRDYYVYNFPVVAGQVSKHPARYAISIFYNTSDQFKALLLQGKDFN